MDYFKKISEAISFTLKYKSLWIFGLILGIFGGGFGGENFNLRESGGVSERKYDEATEAISDFFEKPAALVLLICILLIAIVIGLIGWYLTSVSKGALISSVKVDKEGGTPTVSKGWKAGQKKAFDFILADLIGIGIMLVAFLPVLCVVILGIILPPMFILLCCLVPVYIIFFIYWGATYTGAQRYIVLKDMSAWESIKAGWELAKRSLSDYIVGWLASLLPGCAWALLLIPLSLVSVLILVAIGVGSILTSPLFGIFVIIVLVFVFMFLIAIVNSPFVVFSHTYWTKVVMELMEKE